MENIKETNQKIEIINRKIINIVGVDEVVSSTDKEVFVKIDKEIAQIVGEGLKIVKLVPEEKFLVVDGRINGIVYSFKRAKKSFLGKVLK